MTDRYLALEAVALTVLGIWALVFVTALVLIVAAAHTHRADVREAMRRHPSALTECERCGKDDCFCPDRGDGWRDLMDAARDEEAAHDGFDWDAAEAQLGTVYDWQEEGL